MISHTCQSRAEGQTKARLIAQQPGIELHVVVPARWKHYGKWRTPEVGAGDSLFQVEPVRWPWVGPGQCYLHHYPRMRSILDSFQPHVIDLWEEPWGLVSAHTIRLNARSKSPAKVISETEQNIDKRLPPPFESFRRYTLRRADFLIGRSSEAVDVARRKGFTGNSAVVPNGVDIELFRPLDRAACRRELSVEGFTVGYVGRFVEEKGIDDLLAALAGTSANAVFIGDGPMREAIPSRVDARDGSNRIRIVAQQPPGELVKWMNAIDVLALPSRTTPRWKEQFGRVLVEAGACGTPVIAARSGAIADVVGSAGLLVPERSPADLASAIRQLQDNPSLCKQFADAGRQQASQQYAWSRVAESMANIYRSVAR
jgi:glycosyltransferase involved in cell wall biosynthesis